MATTPKAQASLAKARAQELLDFNNAAQSNKSDKLLSILEAGEGSSIARDQLDHYLHNYLEAILAPGGVPTLNYEWAQLRKCLSIKEKISFAAGMAYAYEGETVHGVAAASSDNIADERLRDTLNELTLRLEDHVINNRDFTESRILRNAAVNRFECKLSTTETHQLNEFATKIKTECNNNGLETLGESTHFTNESDAQKIMKLSDIMIQMSAVGVNVDEKLLKTFEKFDEKIKPLKDLDKHFKHVTKTLNMLHRVAQKGYHAMIRPAQQEKLQTILSKVDMLKTVNDALIGFNNIENFEKNEEHGFLDNLLVKITSRSNFKETLYSMAISEAEFNEWFYSACTFNLMQAAKNGLHHQKGIAFGNRLKDFEADTQSRRGLVRRRIFDIADRMPGDDFGNETDFETANSYFNKFKDLFFAKEEDNYENAPDADAEVHYDKMRRVVSAIIRRRVPALASSHRIRRGSAGRIVYKIIENGLKGKDRGMFHWMKRVRHNADDATVVAMVVMTQNEATNQVFYQDQDKTKKSDSRWGKLWNKISFTEHGRKAVRDAIAPTVNKALTFTEESVKKGLQLTKGVAKVGNKIGSKLTRGLTRSLGGLAGGFNSMIKKGGYKRWKTPLYIPYIATAAIEPLAKLGYKGATYTDRMGNKDLDTVGKVVGQGYDEAKKLVSKATGEDVNYLFQGLTYTTEKVTELAGKTISATGKRVHDSYTTGQQRSILGAFYSAAKEQKGLEDLMQSSDLVDILNLKERGPYLFDEDGRIVISDNVQKKDKSSPEAAGKDFGEELEKQYKKALKQAEAEIIKREKEYEDAIAKADDNQKIQANIRLQNAQTTSNAINSLGAELSGLVNIIKRPMSNAVPPVRRHAEINGRIVALRGVVGPIIAGINIPALQADCSTAFKEVNKAASDIQDLEEELKSLNYARQQRGADIAAIGGLIDAKKRSKNRAIARQTKAIESYNQRQAELLEAQKRLGFMNRIDQMINKIDDIDTRMTAAATDDERKEIAKELLEYTQDLNLLLYPEGQKEKNKDTINLKDVTEEQRKKIEELLSA